MLPSLIEEIREYAALNLSSELGDEVNLTLALCDAFRYNAPYTTLPDVMFDVNREDKDITQQKFIQVFSDAASALLTMHGIGIRPDAELHIKNQVVSVLFRLQAIDDPTPILRITETALSDEEQLARIIDSYSTIDEAVFLSVLDGLDPSFIPGLQAFLYAQETAIEQREAAESDENKAILKNLRAFFTLLGSDNLACALLENGVSFGAPFETYFAYIEDALLSGTDDQIALNLLALFLMSSDGSSDPLQFFRAMSETLIPTHEHRLRIEGKLTELLNSFHHYLKANDDAQRVSPVQHPA